MDKQNAGMYLIKMAYIKTAYESHRQCTLIKLIFDDVIKPLDPKQLKIAWYARMMRSKNFKIRILASKQVSFSLVGSSRA